MTKQGFADDGSISLDTSNKKKGKKAYPVTHVTKGCLFVYLIEVLQSFCSDFHTGKDTI